MIKIKHDKWQWEIALVRCAFSFGIISFDLTFCCTQKHAHTHTHALTIRMCHLYWIFMRCRSNNSDHNRAQHVAVSIQNVHQFQFGNNCIELNL